MSQDLATEPDRDVEIGAEPDSLYEVIDGRIVEPPPMSSRESHLASILGGFLTHHVWTHQLGRVEVEMLFKLVADRNQKRRPDVSFVSFDRWPKHRRVPAVNGWVVVPDLAIEVVSPTDGAVDLIEKVEEYLDAGVRRVWAVYPAMRCVYDYASAKAITILRVGDKLDGADVLPGFVLSLADLFEVHLEDEDDDAGAGDRVEQ